MKNKAPACPKTWAAVKRSPCISLIDPEPENGFVDIWLADGWASDEWSGSREDPTISIHAYWDEKLPEPKRNGLALAHWDSALKDLQRKWSSIFWKGVA